VNHPKETLKGDLQKAKRDCPDHVHSDQMVLWTVRQESGPHERQSKALKTKLAKGGEAIRLESTQIIMMAGREARPCERPPKMLKGELENNSRKPRDLEENWHSVSLKKFNLLFFRVRRRREMKFKLLGKFENQVETISLPLLNRESWFHKSQLSSTVW
jgi:hypothetical protein